MGFTSQDISQVLSLQITNHFHRRYFCTNFTCIEEWDIIPAFCFNGGQGRAVGKETNAFFGEGIQLLGSRREEGNSYLFIIYKWLKKKEKNLYNLGYLFLKATS